MYKSRLGLSFSFWESLLEFWLGLLGKCINEVKFRPWLDFGQGCTEICGSHT